MTETRDFNTSSINTLTTATDGGRQVLLVGLKAAYQEKPQYQRALKREFDQCRDIEHPNILKYLEEKDADGRGHCIVMEWEPARTLADYILEDHSQEEKKGIVRQIAAALDFLHQHGQVHGALNPTVVFITTQGDRVKLLNFRLRFADHLYEPTATMKFRAPEAKDGTVTLDARTDIFSLGTIVREMGLGADYQSVVAGSCSFGRNDRYPDIDSFLEAFDHHRAPRRNAVRESTAPGSNKKAAILVSVIVALIVVAALAFFNRGNSAAEADQPVAAATDTTAAATPEAGQPAASAVNASPTAATEPSADTPTSPTATSEAYSGELEFMNKLVPQMHIDLDKIYAKGGDAAAIRKRVQVYYKGLRKALGNLNDAQFAAYDKAFADYVAQKNAE